MTRNLLLVSASIIVLRAAASAHGLPVGEPPYSAGDDEDIGWISDPEIYTSKTPPKTPENVRNFDLLSMTWEMEETAQRFVARLVRAGSKTISVQAAGKTYELPIAALTEQSQRQLRRFQVKGRVEPFEHTAAQRAVLEKWSVRAFQYVRSPGNVLNFLLYSPPGATSDLPLLVFLHGNGGAGADNFKQWTDGGNAPRYFVEKGFQEYMPCFVMIPQSADRDECWSGDYLRPKSVTSLVAQAIDVLKISVAPRIDMRRLYITGLSAGAYGCYHALQVFPGKFAAAVPVAGDWVYDEFNRYNARPMWMSFNRADKAITPELVDGFKRRWRILSIDFRVSMLKGKGHNAWTETYENPELRKWLTRQALPWVTYPSDLKDPVGQ